MATEKIGEYLAVGYESHGSFLDENVYAQALDELVLACVDIVVMNKGKMLLGKRVRDPHPDWWIIGGRMRAGEMMAEAARRLILAEAGLIVSVERLEYVTTFLAAWEKRAHAPEDHGTHTVSLVMKLVLTDIEVSSLKLNDEYSAHKWTTPQDIIEYDAYHPALRQCAYALREIIL